MKLHRLAGGLWLALLLTIGLVSTTEASDGTRAPAQSYGLSSALERALELKRAWRYAEALEGFADVLDVSPRNVKALVESAYIHNLHGRHGKAMEMANRALQMESRNSQALEELGYGLWKSRKPREAIGPLQLAVKNDPRNLAALRWLKDVYEELNEFEMARDVQRLLEIAELLPRIE
jgi:Tfp pilus assembly protein PilF